jgi:hypothetical protein
MEQYMRRIWVLCLSLIIAVFSLQCASNIQYWTYHQGTPPDHISQPVIIPVQLDSHFLPSQVEEIKAALNEWNGVFNGQIVLALATHPQLGVDKKMHTYPTTFNGWKEGQSLMENYEKSNLGWAIFALTSNDPNLSDAVPRGTLAYVEGIDEHGIYVVTDRLGTRNLKVIMMHEMAHLLGAIHVNTDSLEYPYASNSQVDCIDKITVLQVAHIRHLNFDSLNYCQTPNLE